MRTSEPLDRADAEYLVGARQALGYSQQELADRLSVRRDTLARWENNREPIPYRVPAELREWGESRISEIREYFDL